MGYIYVLKNAGMPGLLKIGHGPPKRRARELSGPTGVPHPFEVAAQWEVSQPKVCEKAIHTALNRHRENTRREFFRVDLDVARQAVERTLLELGERQPPKQAARITPAPPAPRVSNRSAPTTESRTTGRHRAQSVWSAIKADQKKLGW